MSARNPNSLVRNLRHEAAGLRVENRRLRAERDDLRITIALIEERLLAQPVPARQDACHDADDEPGAPSPVRNSRPPVAPTRGAVAMTVIPPSWRGK
jgi:hypothetical protein